MNNLETVLTVCIASVKLVVATYVQLGLNGNKYWCFSALCSLENTGVFVCVLIELCLLNCK